MNTEAILEKLKSMLQTHFDIDPTHIQGDTRMRELGIDSMHVVDLMLEVEAEMGVRFDSLSLVQNPSLAELSAEIAKNMKDA